MQLTPPPPPNSSSSASGVLPFFSNCHLQCLIALSFTLSSVLTQHVLLASFICTQMLNFQLYSNNSQSFISSPWVLFLPIHCLLSGTWMFPRHQVIHMLSIQYKIHHLYLLPCFLLDSFFLICSIVICSVAHLRN